MPPLSEFPTTANREELEAEILADVAKHEVPRTSRRFFKGANIDDLTKLFHSEEIREINLLYACGELNEEDLLEYYSHLPEYQEILNKMDTIISNMIAFIKKSLPSATKKTVSHRQGSFNLSPIMELMREADILVNSYQKGETPLLFTSTLAGRFIIRIGIQIGLEFIEEIKKLPISTQQKQTMVSEFLRHMNRIFHQLVGGDYAGIYYVRFQEMIQNATTRFHPQSFQDLLKAGEVHQDINESKKLAEDKFELITEMDPLIPVTNHAKMYGRAKLEIAGLGDYLDPLSRSTTMYQFRINLDPKDGENYNIHIVDGTEKKATTTGFQVNDKILDGLVERATGDVCLTVGLPYRVFLGEEAELKLKHAVYDAILEHLAEREHELLRKTKSLIPADIVETTRQPVDEVCPEAEMDKDFEPAQADATTEQPEDDREDLVYKKRLRGLKGNVVLKALKSLLEHVRTSGSHHIFVCRSGKTYPIAIHSKKDVGTGLLCCCLKKFGITPKEFVECL